MDGFALLNARATAKPRREAEFADVTDLSHEGRGVAHVDGKTVFIEDALPGERVEWVRFKRGRNFDEGRLERVIESSPDRVTPQCAHFGVCGGCALQHLSTTKQLEFKQQQLSEALTRIGRATPAEILPPLQAGVWNYRRRARLAARWVPKKNRTVVGFRERSAPYIADLKGCAVLRPPADKLIEPLSLLASALSVRNRLPQIEVAVADNAVALVVRVLEPLTPADRELLEQFGRDHDVRIYLQPGGYETVAPLMQNLPALEYRLPAFDLTLQFEPTDFVQVNGELNAKMIERAVELLHPSAGESVLDLFCGLGNFSLPLARSGAHIVGVEGDANLIARARANAERNGLTSNTEFFTANLADESSAAASWAARRYEKVLLDPPRAGAKEVLSIIARSGATTVLYISCHPGSLARDAGILVHEHGYRLKAAGVMDMFPHTTHVESAALFERAATK
ncbi:MAG: 23S rRNA (uracil(1939)-C(5))-methyltransferase RlmD [Steroidobacter sp.]